ncbi:hypothetical protein AB0L53_08310 [Nonomuraea sp. NPDC052129]
MTRDGRRRGSTAARRPSAALPGGMRESCRRAGLTTVTSVGPPE